MGSGTDEHERRPLPRWRYASQAVLGQEHAGDPDVRRARLPSTDELGVAAYQFSRSADPSTATELLSVALHCGDLGKARDAARFLSRMERRVPNTVLTVLRSVSSVDPTNSETPHSTSPLGGLPTNDAIAVIRHYRTRLLVDPRNTVLWLDLGRAHTVLGHFSSAERAMRVALGLAPDHRVVLRNFARWLVHVNRREEAWELVRHHRRTSQDPWLMATEIALAGTLNKSPVNAARAQRILSSNTQSPASTTELASALGALEIAAGAHRRGRRLLRQSLIAPTDNAIAQAEWTARRDPTFEVPLALTQTAGASEARYWRATAEGNWSAALSAAVDWHEDEPYSSRPAINGSHLALYFESDSDLAVRLAREGTIADPSDQLLRNNLVVALIHAGASHHVEAQREFARIGHPKQATYPRFVYLATAGLVLYSCGDMEGARRLYSRAEDEAPDEHKRRVQIHAFDAESLFSPETASSRLTPWSAEMSSEKDPYLRELARRIKLRHSNRLLIAKGAPVPTSTTYVLARK